MNPASDSNNECDVPINVNAERDLSGMHEIPDIKKSLRAFCGDPSEFLSWEKSVERYSQIFRQADIALESYNTPLNWPKISKCLTLHYAEKGNLGTLEYQMTTLMQGNNSIHEFYQIVYHHLFFILNKLSSMKMGRESLRNMRQCYEDKLLDTFVRGLNGDLPQALHFCLKLQNIDYKTQHANNLDNSHLQRNFSNVSPPVPPKEFNPQASCNTPNSET